VQVSPWCSLSRELPTRCAELQEGTSGGGLGGGLGEGGVPLPEVRLQGRTGVGAGWDVGLSLHGSARAGPGSGFSGVAVRTGLFGDVKRELLARPLEGGARQVLSVAPGLGVSLVPQGPRGAWAPDLEVALPVLAGHQTAGWELVGGVQVVQRLALRPGAADPQARLLPRTDAGLTLGAYSRGPARVAWQLGYLTPVTRPGDGAFQLGFGLVFDVAPPPLADAPGPAPRAER
jgi:hypothetical protein